MPRCLFTEKRFRLHSEREKNQNWKGKPSGSRILIARHETEELNRKGARTSSQAVLFPDWRIAKGLGYLSMCHAKRGLSSRSASRIDCVVLRSTYTFSSTGRGSSPEWKEREKFGIKRRNFLVEGIIPALSVAQTKPDPNPNNQHEVLHLRK